ncbi:hypothetical protein ACFX19_004412 [Malus domestica]
MKDGRHMLSGEGVAVSSPRFKSKRRSEGPDIFKCVEEGRGQTNQDLRSARNELLLVEIQKSKRRLLSQKLGCSETTRADLRNRRGVCFLKSWAAQRPRGPILEIEEAPAFSASSAPVTCTLSFAEITGTLSKISGEAREFRSSSYPTITHKGKGTAPLLDNWKVPMCVDLRVLRQDRSSTGLLVRKPKRHNSQNFESQISLDKACLSHYIAVTKKGKGLALLLVIGKSLYTLTSLLNGQANLQKCSTLSRIRKGTLNITSRNTQLYFPPIIPQQISHTKNKSISYHQGRKQEYPISCFLPVFVFVLVHTCRTRRKRAVSRNLKSNLQFGTDCLEPLPGCLLSIALEYSSSTAVKVTNSTGKYLMTVDQILALYTEAAKRG